MYILRHWLTAEPRYIADLRTFFRFGKRIKWQGLDLDIWRVWWCNKAATFSDLQNGSTVFNGALSCGPC